MDAPSDDHSVPRRSARLRKLKESKRKVVSEYFTQPETNSAAALGLKRTYCGKKRNSDQSK